MLVVRRRIGEAIAIGDDIEIEVIEISRTRVKLGIRAPRQVQVNRRESAAVASENRQASGLIANQGTRAVGGMLALLRNVSRTPL
jgi:carbon storage regulator